MIYTFSGNELDTKRHVLTRNGAQIPVEPQVFDVLRVLAEHAGSVVSKDELIDAVWNGRIVSEATISGRINAARTAVGDNGKDQSIIRTVQRRGFEMVAEVVQDETAEQKPLHAEISQTIRYTSSEDGRSIAWSSAGEGPPVLLAWHHLSHLEGDWDVSIVAPSQQRIAQSHRLIRYDVRGAGLSEALRPEDTLESHVADMKAVADAAGLDRFPIVALLQNTAVAVRFAALYPERVSGLVLHNAYAVGRALRDEAPPSSDFDPFIALIKSGGWGDPDNGFMRAWITMVMPQISPDEATEMITLVGRASTPDDAILQRDLIDRLDVRADLKKVQAPTLVIHPRRCGIHPVAEGRRVAAGIPNAEFLEMDTSNTFFAATAPEHERVMTATLQFLDRFNDA